MALKGMVVEIFRHRPVCKSNMFKTSEVLVVGSGLPEIFEAYDRPVAELRIRNIGKVLNVVLAPYEHTGWTMFGGTYAMTSDSRFVEVIRKILNFDFYGAIPVHDWTEDPNFMKD